MHPHPLIFGIQTFHESLPDVWSSHSHFIAASSWPEAGKRFVESLGAARLVMGKPLNLEHVYVTRRGESVMLNADLIGEAGSFDTSILLRWVSSHARGRWVNGDLVPSEWVRLRTVFAFADRKVA